VRLAGKTAVVTGSSRGIGRAIALAMARDGANVVVNYRDDRSSAETVAGEILGMGAGATVVKADVTLIDDVKRLAVAAIETFGQVDILVNNAGIIADNYVTFMKEEEWDSVIDTDLKGAFLGTKIIGRDMMRRKAGRIINISSDAGILGDMMRANYASAKAGLIGLTRAVAREFAAHGITVNAIAPGIVLTDMVSGMSEAKKNRQLDMIPQHRFGTPDDVASVAVFLASDDASYITGQVLRVDGGLGM
jgi:3-oxoacyl-[acyl-carrier protein] reductase